MQDFLSNNALYIVLTIALICWVGIVTYLMRMDKKIAKLEQQLKK